MSSQPLNKHIDHVAFKQRVRRESGAHDNYFAQRTRQNSEQSARSGN